MKQTIPQWKCWLGKVSNTLLGNISNERYLNKASTSDTNATFLDLDLLIFIDIISTKVNDKSNDFDFESANTVLGCWCLMCYIIRCAYI